MRRTPPVNRHRRRSIFPRNIQPARQNSPIVVTAPAIKEPIRTSPGFRKKGLSSYKLDIMALCGFGCRYCSSNAGNYLRINRGKFAAATKAQHGTVHLPSDEPRLTIQWEDILERLDAQLATKPKQWGAGETLVFSMLTDGFSPITVNNGVTQQVLEWLVHRTSFRIRILTKNAVVGTSKWLSFFSSHPGRFVVGLSIGTTDDEWAKKFELLTSPPSSRLKALHALQAADVPTYGMACPVFPHVLTDRGFEELVDAVRPEFLEHFWAEPFNSRHNWEHVRDGYDVGSFGYEWFTEVYGNRDKARWSRYATDLYLRLQARAAAQGWLSKLRYLLYEGDITEADANRFRGLQGVWLQSRPGDDGHSQNPHIAKLQPRDRVA